MKHVWIGFSVLLVLLFGCTEDVGTVQTVDQAPIVVDDTRPALSAVDREFVRQAAMAGLMEVQLGEVADNQAASPEVKEFGRQMVDDHGKANQQLMQLAGQKNVRIPSELEGKHRETVDRLSRLRGAEFDRAYVTTMVEDHEADIAKFQRQSREGKDPDLKAFVERTLPVLEKHLQHARELSERVKPGSSGGR